MMTKQYQDKGQGRRAKRPMSNDQRSTSNEEGIEGIRRSGPDRDITMPTDDVVLSDAWMERRGAQWVPASTEGRAK